MNKNIALSIIVPVYKVEAYLEDCVTSIEKYASKYNFFTEVILVDDGSPDKCPFICDKLQTSYKNINVIHQKNAGLGAARNVGIKEAKGDYIYFIDSDDLIEEGVFIAVENNISQLKDLIVTTKVVELDCRTNNKTIFNYVPNSNDLTEILSYDILNKVRVGYTVYNRNFILYSNIFFSEKRDICEDDTFRFYLLQMATSVAIENNSFYEYKANREGSLVNSMADVRVIPTIEDTIKVINSIDNSIYNNKDQLKSKYASRLISYLITYKNIKDDKIKQYVINVFNKYYCFLKKGNTRLAKLLWLKYILGYKNTLKVLAKIKEIKSR